jgi:NAD+ kinase
MKVALTANPHKPTAVELARRAARLLGPRVELVASDDLTDAMPKGVACAPLESLDAEVIVAIGGDGTFLYTLQRTSIPILPINAGTVGFLAEVDGSNLKAFEGALDRVVLGRYFVESRMKLASQVAGHHLPDATNEVVVHTSQVAKMRLFEIGIDGRPVGRIRADGVILATATGSTSYSLSALGPILDPTVEGIIVSALAPFQATQRAVGVDGQNESRLPGGGSVVAYRSSRRAEFLRFGSRFFRRLQGKKILPWSEEVADGEASDDADVPAHP